MGSCAFSWWETIGRTKGYSVCWRRSAGWRPYRFSSLVVGRDIVDPYRSTLARLHLEDRVAFLPLRLDVEFYYAAADLYVGPSLEDAFGMPPLEAMACGVSSIVSSQVGGQRDYHRRG